MFVLQSVEYENVHFLTEDLYNRIDKQWISDITDGDAKSAIGISLSKA